MWPEWSAWTWWGLAAATLPLYALPTVWDRWGAGALRRLTTAYDTRNWKKLLESLGNIAGISVLAAPVVIVLFARNPNPVTMIWTHPAMPTDEQRQVAAECRMMATGAVDIVGGNRRERSERIAQRNSYLNDCLRSRGFVRVPRDDDG